jgi:hypothetical protein
MDSWGNLVGHRLDRPASNLHNLDWLAIGYRTNPEMLDLIVARPIVGEARQRGNGSQKSPSKGRHPASNPVW